jgi:hypothetical protein
MSKRAAKELAQIELMHGIGNVLGHWRESEGIRDVIADLGLTDDEFTEILWDQAEMVARLLGFECAWEN